jgi:hypothetical protein
MADLHRLPHRLGDAGPGGVDQRRRRRAGDEDPRQVEQQGRILVAARIQPGQRHQQFAAADIGVADQVEGGIGGDEAVLAERPQQMRRGGAHDAFDLAKVGRARRRRRRRRLWVLQMDGIQQLRDRLADRGPVRLRVVARPDQRLAQRLQARLVAQFGKPGPAQQGPQRRIAERGLVELGEVRVAAGMVQQQGVADVVERWAVLAGRQGTVGGSGDAMKIHYSFFLLNPLSHVPPGPPNPLPMAAAPAGRPQVLEIDTISNGIPM